MSIFTKIFTGSADKIINSVGNVLDEVITTQEEKDAAKLAIQKVLLEAEKDAFAKEVEDRKSARDMYKDDAMIQKILATLFTVAYFGITFVMFSYFVTKSIDLGEFEISFISTIFGAMSSKVNTIIDFFFGGSSKKSEPVKK
jgi:hypothetical protein|tara:strand:- start:1319 stop:1744 length:426 start_codon:yes stop_codon:yes gene_type:complete